MVWCLHDKLSAEFVDDILKFLECKIESRERMSHGIKHRSFDFKFQFSLMLGGTSFSAWSGNNSDDMGMAFQLFPGSYLWRRFSNKQ